MIDNKPPEPQEKNIITIDKYQTNNQNKSNNQGNNRFSNNHNNNGNNNDDNNNNTMNNNNIKKDNDKKAILYSKKNISPFLIIFAFKENNEKLDELISDLILFKEENAKNISQEIGFKQTLFYNLEKNLIELCFLMNESKRKDRLIKLYLWYKNKKRMFDDLKKITNKTYKEANEIDDLEVFLQKEEEKKQAMEANGSFLDYDKRIEEIYKHRNKGVLYKEMLNDYKTKKIIIKNILKNKLSKNDSNLNETEKKLQKTTSFMPPSTVSDKPDISNFYTTQFGQNLCSLKKDLVKTSSSPFYQIAQGGSSEQSFFCTQGQDKSYFPKINKETKSSYSFNRPPYKYYSINVENKIINSKMRNAAEKRNAEEIDQKLSIYGYQKAKLNESVINKYELKDVIKMYANSNNFDSNMLQKYISKKKTEKKENEKTIRYRFSNMNLNKIKNEKPINFCKGFKKSQSCSNFIYNYKEEKQKMETDSVRNIDYNTKSIIEKNKEDIKVIKMKLKEPKETIKKKLLNYHRKHNYSKMPNDVMADLFYNSGLYKQKILNNKLCDLSTKKEGKIINSNESVNDSDDENHNFYISMYDFNNLKKIESFKNISRPNNSTNYKPNDKLNKTFYANRNNFLNFRKTVSYWKKKDFEKLSNKIKNEENLDNYTNIKTIKSFHNFHNDINEGMLNKEKNNLKQKKHISLLNAMVNPNEESAYPQYFLPRSGSLLLKRIGDNIRIINHKKKKK